MTPPLLSTIGNALLEDKLNHLFQLDPFWREHLQSLNGLRLGLALTDIGFKRVIQFGPSKLHLAAPYAGWDCHLTTQTRHLNRLKDAHRTEEGLSLGYFFLQGSPDAFEQITASLRRYDGDIESKLAEFLPPAAVYQAHSIAQLAAKQLANAAHSFQESYYFWRDNETHR